MSSSVALDLSVRQQCISEIQAFINFVEKEPLDQHFLTKFDAKFKVLVHNKVLHTIFTTFDQAVRAMLPSHYTARSFASSRMSIISSLRSGFSAPALIRFNTLWKRTLYQFKETCREDNLAAAQSAVKTLDLHPTYLICHEPKMFNEPAGQRCITRYVPALGLAGANGAQKIVDWLINRKMIDVNYCLGAGGYLQQDVVPPLVATAASTAIDEKAKIVVVRKLIDAKADPLLVSASGSLWMSVCHRGHMTPGTLQVMLEGMKDINYPTIEELLWERGSIILEALPEMEKQIADSGGSLETIQRMLSVMLVMLFHNLVNNGRLQNVHFLAETDPENHIRNFFDKYGAISQLSKALMVYQQAKEDVDMEMVKIFQQSLLHLAVRHKDRPSPLCIVHEYNVFNATERRIFVSRICFERTFGYKTWL